MTYFGFNFNFYEILFLGILLFAFIFQSAHYIGILFAFGWRKRKIAKNKITFVSPLPAVSIIVCSTDEDQNLKKNIPLLLEQDYPQFEIIVVNECSEDNTEQVLLDLRSLYPQLKITFVPLRTTIKNTRQLAVMLGVKAARNDVLLFTSPCCTPQSKQWIKSMMRNFTPKTDFVLGMTLSQNKTLFWRRMFALESFLRQLKILSSANRGKVFTINNNNFACRKEIFYKNNGFAPFLNLPNGDIELLANRQMRRHNCRIENAAESIMWENSRMNFNDWQYHTKRLQRIEMNFNFLGQYRKANEGEWRILFYLSFILCLITGNMLVMATALLLFVLRSTLRLLSLNYISKNYNFGKYFPSLIFVDFVLPLIKGIILLKKKNRY
ncbi:MAG: glycosyltransferase [Paludibacter sp.]|jgi:glycosyltransferase involved in cell wall biosynthesis|nr:glycosyltransferase [Paludibacter sp.]